MGIGKAVVRSGWLAIVLASSLSACKFQDKAGIELNLDTAAEVNRAAITALQVSVNGQKQSYLVGTVLAWSVGITTHAGNKHIGVDGMANDTMIVHGETDVIAVAGKVITWDLVLKALGTPSAPASDWFGSARVPTPGSGTATTGSSASQPTRQRIARTSKPRRSSAG